MTHLMFDNIIFGLQRFGGISNFWTRLLEAAARWEDSTGEMVVPKKLLARDLPNTPGFIPHIERLPTAVSRYLPVNIRSRQAIFHTSYYRRPCRAIDRYFTSVYDFTYERYFSGLSKLVHHQQKRASILAADMSVCISASTRTDLLNQFPKVDPARTCVIPLGVDRTRFYPEPGHGQTPPYALFVGQRVGYKRFDLAVDAVAQVPELSLVIVGPALSAEEKARLDGMIPGRWHEMPDVTPQRLRQLYSDAFVFIFPSDYEGFGLPILEAMACHCPVIAANRSSFPEVAGDAALLADEQSVDAYADLLRVLEDSQFRASLIRKGAERIGLFNWQRTFNEFQSLYAR